MHFTTTTVISLLPAMGMATSYRGVGSDQSPIGTTGMSMLQANAGRAPGENECGVSTFQPVTQVEENLPLVEDCLSMLDDIREDEEWTVNTEPQTIVSKGTCAFNAVTRSGEAEVGNSDVIDLVTDSIDKWRKNHPDEGNFGCHGGFPLYVSYAGTMPCEELRDDKKRVVVDWTIAHSGDDNKGTQWIDEYGNNEENPDEEDQWAETGSQRPGRNGGNQMDDWNQDEEEDSFGGSGGGRTSRTGSGSGFRRPGRQGWADEEQNTRGGSRNNRMGTQGWTENEEMSRGGNRNNRNQRFNDEETSWGSGNSRGGSSRRPNSFGSSSGGGGSNFFRRAFRG